METPERPLITGMPRGMQEDDSSSDEWGDEHRHVVDRTITECVVDALASARGVEPTNLPRPLADSLDPEALNDLFAPRHDGSPRDGDGYVEFTSNGYRVVVENGGEVVLEPLVEQPL